VRDLLSETTISHAHTRAGGWHRLVTPATFSGTVRAGADYLLVDHHVGFGGTLANLRSHISMPIAAMSSG